MELTEANAAQALAAAIDADAASAAGTSPEPVTPQPSEVDAGATAPEPQAVEDSFTRADLDALKAGLDPVAAQRVEQAYKSFQGDYTQKMQEYSPYRREVEAFGGLDQVRQALEFVSNLRDPDNLVQFHGELSQYLQSQGLTKVEADAEASRQIQAPNAAGDPYEDYEFDNDPQDAALQREVAELREWRESFERERQAEAMERELIRMENFIRSENPHYSDDDIKECYALSWAYGGDLLAGQEAFEASRQRILASYANSKATAVPPAVAPPSAAPGGQVPQSFGSDFDAAHEYAKQRLAAEVGMGAFDLRS